MAGTKAGGAKAAATNKRLHGADYYARIGALGGRNGHTGGFGSEEIGADGLTGWERAKIVGAKGGRNSKRGKAKAKSSLNGCRVYVHHKKAKAENILVKGA